jgi:hypothetical protein
MNSCPGKRSLLVARPLARPRRRVGTEADTPLVSLGHLPGRLRTTLGQVLDRAGSNEAERADRAAGMTFSNEPMICSYGEFGAA